MEELVYTTISNYCHADDEMFNTELLAYVNGSLQKLTEAGAVKEDFQHVTTETGTWEECVQNGKYLPGVKEFVCMRTKLFFDPPQSSFLVNSIQKELDELFWRLGVL